VIFGAVSSDGLVKTGRVRCPFGLASSLRLKVSSLSHNCFNLILVVGVALLQGCELGSKLHLLPILGKQLLLKRL
jgi:hypothetical protein